MTKKTRQDGLKDEMMLEIPETPLKKQRRTPRACDRCRLKRIKCDGMAQCQPCIKSDSPCLYTHQRNSASKNYHWQMRDVMNEALRRMYVACKSRSGFPGTMPVGSDNDNENVSVQAILEGLGLIPSPGAEIPPCDSFDAQHNVWRVMDTSKSTTPLPNPEDMVPSMPKEHLPLSLCTQGSTSHGKAMTSTSNMVPPIRKDEYQGRTTLTTQVSNSTAYLSHPTDYSQGISSGPRTHQPSFYQVRLDSGTPWCLGSTATPPLGYYDLSYAY